MYIIVFTSLIFEGASEKGRVLLLVTASISVSLQSTLDYHLPANKKKRQTSGSTKIVPNKNRRWEWCHKVTFYDIIIIVMSKNIIIVMSKK